MDEKTIARFWAKVDKRGPIPAHRPDLGPCWIWMAAKLPFGHGQFSVALPGGRNYVAHRFSWFLEHGECPRGLFVLHHCDNPSCVRPSHFFLGTKKDNTQDMMKKGRHIAIRKFSEETIQAIRIGRESMTYRELAEKHGMSLVHAYDIVNFNRRFGSRE